MLRKTAIRILNFQHTGQVNPLSLSLPLPLSHMLTFPTSIINHAQVLPRLKGTFLKCILLGNRRPSLSFLLWSQYLKWSYPHNRTSTLPDSLFESTSNRS